jgi:hypothetical protein
VLAVRTHAASSAHQAQATGGGTVIVRDKKNVRLSVRSQSLDAAFESFQTGKLHIYDGTHPAPIAELDVSSIQLNLNPAAFARFRVDVLRKSREAWVSTWAGQLEELRWAWLRLRTELWIALAPRWLQQRVLSKREAAK